MTPAFPSRAAVLLFFGVLLSCLAPRSDAAPPAPPHTTLRLVADHRTVEPGSTFTAGVVLAMAPGWHTYWINPGDAGMPTTLTWSLPEGFRAGPIQWPVPEKHVEPGDVLSYGYSGETVLPVQITVPASARPGTRIVLRVAAEWLECEKVCIPGEGQAETSLEIAGGRSVAANESFFARARARLPVPIDSLVGFRLAHALGAKSVTLTLTREGSRPVAWNEDFVDFFPAPPTDIQSGRTTVAVRGSEALLTIPLSAFAPVKGSRTLEGVLVTRTGGGSPKGYAVTVPLTEEFCRTLAGESAQTGTTLLDRSFVPEVPGGQGATALYLLFAVIGGLLLNIMPCVLPVIALKVFGLVRMAGDHPRKVRRLGVIFSLGILASFLALALIVILLKVAGQQVGWGFQFQEPLFVIGMSALVFAFGLSLFGVFEIRLPGAAVAGVSDVLVQQEGKGGVSAFLEGVLATILATPCTAPFLGAALGFAFAQPWWMILVIFSCVAAGMALPYLLLTSRPGWMRFLPKPGAWMETAKQFMGFLMMATLLWLLSVVGSQLGVEGVVATAVFLLFVALAAWLVGRFATLTASPWMMRITWAAAAAAVVAGYALFLRPVLAMQSAAGSAPSASVELHGIVWEPFSSTRVEEHLRAQKAVFLDFTAEWCLTCKVNERTVLADDAVVARFRSSGIVPIRADWTSRNAEITQLLGRFGRSGVPLYVIFPPGKPDQPIVLPEVLTSGILLDAFDRAGVPR
jgi:thiol:disulfide interchange protein DsbD